MFIWDEKKNAANKAKHGIEFDSVYEFSWKNAAFLPDNRKDYGEERQRGLGLIDGRLHVVVYVVRNEDIRIISLRRANKREERLYETLKKL